MLCDMRQYPPFVNEETEVRKMITNLPKLIQLSYRAVCPDELWLTGVHPISVTQNAGFRVPAASVPVSGASTTYTYRHLPVPGVPVN